MKAGPASVPVQPVPLDGLQVQTVQPNLDFLFFQELG